MARRHPVSLQNNLRLTLLVSLLFHGGILLFIGGVMTREMNKPADTDVIHELVVELNKSGDTYDWKEALTEPEKTVQPEPVAVKQSEPVIEPVADPLPLAEPVIKLSSARSSEPVTALVTPAAEPREVQTSFKTEAAPVSKAAVKTLSFKSLSKGRKLKAPSYPAVARRWNQEGTVKASLKVNAEGKVVKVSLVESSGFKILDNQVLKTLEKWVFNAPGKNITLIKKFVFRLD